MLSQLVYVSAAVDPFTPADLAELLRTCRRNNEPLGVTGLLLHIGGNFMQALEGEDSAVDELYRKIARDPRHRSVTMIVNLPIKRRLFSDWTMGFKKAQDVPPEIRSEVSSFLEDVVRDGLPPGHPVSPADYLLRTFALTMR